MALKNYGVLKARPIDRRLGFGASPHYQIHLVDNSADYRIAVNVKSKKSPSELLYLIIENYVHPLLDDFKELPAGFTSIERTPGGLALDYIRANLFKPDRMVPLPFDVPGPDNDLNEKIDYHVQRALAEEDAMIYAFGERWGPEPNDRDKYFGFKPGNGIHDIHMNQGNVEEFQTDNGVWQDGGMLLHLPAENRWVAVFLAFQSQCWHTDDNTGNCIGDAQQPAEDKGVVIIAGTVNPTGHDPGMERVLLLNTLAAAVDLNGWALADKNKRRHPLDGINLDPGAATVLTLPGTTIQLSNNGGIITLLNREGLKVHGVNYTKEDVSEQGRTIVF
ncbi:MAG: YukJ family protein [Deltaproteobacteria bacterium]|nr:YukJ family protein [Deltaproteobacteria bacterium]